MPLSTNTLFHFTSKLDHLLSILEHGFRPGLCLESLPIPGEFVGAIPMVCFCDIPLSQAAAHMEKYGFYAIGLSKTWASTRRVSPVLYVRQKSQVAKSIEVIMSKAERGEGHEWEDAFRFASFVKPYEAMRANKRRSPEKVRFYDEREWRWVPELRGKALRYGIPQEEFADLRSRAAANRKLWNMAQLSFRPSDIRFLVVERENEIVSLSRRIDSIKHAFSEHQRRLLATRIVSASRIQSDF